MKRISVLGFAITITFLLVFYGSSSGVTDLSKKASNLKMGMSRNQVINLLGQPTWAVIPGDKGDWALPDSAIGLELHWKNPGCSPVVVQFDTSLKVTGWDEGRAICRKDAHLLNPSDEYSCSKSDRAKYCK